MPALGIACSGASYYHTSVLDVMGHRCKETQPVNAAPETDDNEPEGEEVVVEPDDEGSDYSSE